MKEYNPHKTRLYQLIVVSYAYIGKAILKTNGDLTYSDPLKHTLKLLL